MARALKPGDVLELAGNDYLIYLHYLGRHPDYGDCLRVSAQKHLARTDNFESAFKESYVIFYPANAAVRQKLASVVGSAAVERMLTRFRRPGARTGTTITNWIVEGPEGEQVRETLSPKERELPISTIWNHAFLLQRMDQGWRPEKEGAE